MTVNSGEILFVKSVKDGIPNRDPLNDSDARRIFDEEDGRISLSDVSVKRDVRDYVEAKFPDGGANKDKFIFVKEFKNEKGKLLGREGIAKRIQSDSGLDDPMDQLLPKAAFDVRVFGAVYSVSKGSFHLTGPVQFGWAHSLHPVQTKYIQGTTTLPSTGPDAEGEGKQQGTIWTAYTLPFAVFALPVIINPNIANKTGMTEEDMELLLDGLWHGTQYRQARGRGIQQPLFMLHVEYNDPFFRIGYLEDSIELLPDREEWLSGKTPSNVSGVELDVTRLSTLFSKYQSKIKRIRLWHNPSLTLKGEIEAEILQG